ncbi:hypothetical protein D6T64_19230 [Cryobacterium melibiosiphilum]|uniref:Uncharacterized protein n=1 Tax=Cryobacterium melibiosiphilum TaxID=995039 RepID=A0A3A5MD10_9MICO|nr:hypothetical protein [Cryobacterium melibiosiphilum]RJT85735.1 hypothetical protein D6T64_19230 [Cryobacterium melibiosiphilum]
MATTPPDTATNTTTTNNTATIIVDAAITKLDALDAIAAALDSPVHGAGTRNPFVALPHGGRVVVDIPKFGEAPPLAIDVSDPRGSAEARRAAQALLDTLVTTTGWPIHHLHG